ncbi:MAG: hypothetical protein O3A95_10770 [Planctomycetota bacterium]|nr:hypothetical protein [Planctomycetota bacterium]MDA1114765.1 hypothetical protein [Planctomycetota bacterium]
MPLRTLSFQLLGHSLALALFVACGVPTVRADVEAFANPDISFQELESFSYLASEDETHALRDLALYQQVRALLEQRGLRETSSGEILITLQTRTGTTTIEYPAHYEMGPHMFRGPSGPYYVRGADGKIHPSLGYSRGYSHGGYYSSPQRTPGRSVPAFSHRLALDFRAPNGDLLWQGTIDMVHRSRDLSSLMKMFLPDLLSEFPAPSGKSLERRVQVEN